MDHGTARRPPADVEKSAVFKLALAGVESFVRVGPRSLSVGRGDDVLNWDRAGRPFAGSVDGFTWHRALDGRMVQIVTSGGGRRARWLADSEIEKWTDVIRRHAEWVAEAGRSGPAEVASAFAPAAEFDREAWRRDAAHFAEVYHPVPILPPDQYLALVLQATIGCSWNRCAFCDFYRDRRYAVRPPEEFRRHAEAVRAFFGRGLAARRSIVLADANAIATPAGRVIEWLAAVRQMFPVRTADGLSCEPRDGDPPSGFDGVHGFLDVVGGARHRPEDWALLAEAGLTRVCLGVETGSDKLLHLLGKPGAAEIVREVVLSLKRAGVAASLVFLAGVGGRELEEEHLRESAALADGLPLSSEDLVYIAPFDDRPDTDYRRLEREAGLTALSKADAWDQAARFKRALGCLSRPGGPRCAIYDVALFAY